MIYGKENETINKNDRPFYQPLIMGSEPFRIGCTEKSSDFPAHWHGDIEILYVLPGSESVYVTADGKTYELTERSAVFISGTVIHSVEVRGHKPNMLLVEMGMAFLGDCFSAFSGKRFSDPFVNFSETKNAFTEKAEALFLKLSDICRERREGGINEFSIPMRMKISSCLFELAYLMAENLKMTSSERRLKQLEAVKAVQNVLTYVENAYFEHITLDIAASMAGYEKTRFSQLFKAAVGTPFHKYLTERRLRSAVYLLEKTTLPVAEIGESVGILHAKSFSRLIRQYYGKTPGEIRRESVRS
ncbi:MAG: AraC family transcriptional regulator [Ruminococcaceae bacterium]|nr:AraC family transcriptional regulator [Oscillospiraceae bacterium]